MLHFVSVGLSCLLMLGTFAAPCSIRAETEDGDVFYCDTPIVYDGSDYSLMSSSFDNFSIPYESRDYNKFDLAIRWPCYTFAPTAGSCAPIAASNLVGFYDRYDENLIPDHLSGRLYGTGYIYSIEDNGVISVIEQLHSLMGTTATTGTTENQFLDGLKNFCSSKGKNVSISSCMSSGSFSFSKAQSYIEDNIPIVLFLSGYNVGNMLTQDHSDAYSFYKSDVNHVMIGFGYAIYTYHTSTGSTIKNYLDVASGIDGRSSGLYDFTLDTKINDALAIHIY